MRIVNAVVWFMFAVVGACADDQATSVGTSSLSESSPSDSESATVCPHICQGDLFCRLQNGSCTGTCNACLCARAGGTIDATCAPGADATSEDPASEAVPPPAEEDVGTVCPNICQEGLSCRLPDGTCRPTCNSCLCARAGGTIDRGCT